MDKKIDGIKSSIFAITSILKPFTLIFFSREEAKPQSVENKVTTLCDFASLREKNYF